MSRCLKKNWFIFNFPGQTAIFCTLGVFYPPSASFNGFSYFSCPNWTTTSSYDTFSLHNIADISRQFALFKYQTALLHSEHYTRRYVAGLSPLRPQFNSRAPHETFLLGNVALVQIFLRVLFDLISHQSSIFKLIQLLSILCSLEFAALLNIALKREPGVQPWTF